MESDSKIIHFTTWSLNKASQNPETKNSSVDRVSALKRRQSLASSTTKVSVKSSHSVKNEIRSFCCVFSHLTFRSCKFHSVKVFLLLICLISIFTNMITGGYISSIITSLQIQYNLSTAKIGYVIASFDIMAIFATPLISYFGSRYNKARIISICNILFSFGCLVFTLPYFFGSRYSLNNSQQALASFPNSSSILLNTSGLVDLCKSKEVLPLPVDSLNLNISLTREATISEDELLNSTCYRSLVAGQWPIYAFIGGQLLMSWGIAPLFPLGITYICDNLDEHRHSMYTGIFYASSALGPAIGYLLGSVFLSVWINISEKPPVTSTDPRWVGLWYMGFIISAGFVLITSFILMTFPPKISRSTISSKPKKSPKKRKQEKTKTTDKFDFNTMPRQKESLETIHEQGEPAESGNINFEVLDSVSTLGNNCDSISQTVSSSELSNTGSDVNILPKTGASSNPKKSKSINPSGHATKKNCSICRVLLLKLKGFLRSFWSLFSNLRYSLLVFIMSVECILVAAFTAYMVFYTQHVYQLTSSTASILVGGVIVPSAIIGAVLGGWLVKKFNMNIEGCSNMIMISSIIVTGLIVLIFLVRCEGKISDGIDLQAQDFNASFVCDSDCECAREYAPTCGVNKVSYLSPCFAGCKIKNDEGYFNCSCIADSGNVTLEGSLPSASIGACPRNCGDKQAIFLVTLFLMVLLESVTLTPITILLMKLVDKPLQAFSLGVARMANVLIAYIPAPIVLSYFIDKTCVLWKYACNGDKGTCLEYDIREFHFTIFGIMLVVKIFSCLLLVIFSAHIHRAFLLKKRFKKTVELNHDMTSVLSSKQKYMIDSEVASLESESVSELANTTNEGGKVKKRSTNLKPVVLKKYLNNDNDNFLSFERSQTPEFFLNN